jgi:tetratricopeptide (TPR) repeat protein
MSEDQELLARWRDLRRHPAVQAAAVYAGASWALVQVADIFFPSPNIVRGLGILLAAGFPIVVGTAWWVTRREREAATGEAAGAGASSPVLRRRRRYAYAAAAGLLIVGGVFWWIRPSVLGAVAPDAQVIAVLPFNTSGPGVELLGEGMVDLLSTNLDAVGAIRTVDSRTVLHRWRQRAEGGSLDLDGSLAVGRDVEAGSILLGSVVSAGPGVRLTAELISVKGVELASVRAEGPADSVLALVDSLGINLLKEIWIAREPIPNLRVAGITTGNVDAIRSYLKGQQHNRRMEWDSASAAFLEALEEDSTFALAHYRLSLTYGWSRTFGSPESLRHSRLALRYGDRLPARERTLITAFDLFGNGRIAAHDTMLGYVRQYPGDPEGWYLLGDVRFHAQPILALTLDDLILPFDRVLDLDPSLALAMWHPLELSLAYDDSARFNRYFTAFEAVVPSVVSDWFARARLLWDDPESVGERLAWIVGEGPLNDEIALNVYRSKTLRPEVVLPALTELAATPELPSQTRIELLSAKATVLASLGRLREARSLFEEVWSLEGPAHSVGYDWVSPVVAGLADSAYAAPIFEVVATYPWDPRDTGPSVGLMVLELSQGRSDEARQIAEQALAAESEGSGSPLAALLRAGQGWADILDGDTIAGLEKLESGLLEAGYARGPVIDMNQSFRFVLATAQAAYSGTREDGIRRLRYGAWMTDLLYLPLTYLLLGRALEDAGDSAGAIEAYSHFLRLWENADAELQPRVETARRALDRLAAER